MEQDVVGHSHRQLGPDQVVGQKSQVVEVTESDEFI